MKFLLPIFLLFAFALFGVNDVFACSCVPLPEAIRSDVGEQVKYGFNRAATVFTGKVTRAEKIKNANGKIGMTVKVVFSVDKIWKGDQTKSFVLYTTGITSLCGYQFKIGKKYLVYAYRGDDKKFGTNICTRTKESKDTEDIKYLDAAKNSL